MKRRKLMLSVLSSAVIAAALAPAAHAQAPAPVAGYGGQAGTPAGTIVTPPPTGGNAGVNAQGNGAQGKNDQGGSAGQAVAGETQDSSGVLAFTGLDLLLIFGGGLALLATGVLLSRLVVRDPA